MDNDSFIDITNNDKKNKIIEVKSKKILVSLVNNEKNKNNNLKNNSKNTLVLLVNNGKLKITLSDYKFWLFSTNPYKYSNLDIYEQMSMDKELYKDFLEFACEYLNYETIYDILNNKTIPTNKCFKNLFVNKYIHDNNKVNNAKSLPDTIDLLIKFGYILTDDDIIYATIKGVILNDCIFTRRYVPSEKFYDACFSHKKLNKFSNPFIPKYNELCIYDIRKKMEECENRYKKIEKIKNERDTENKLKFEGFSESVYDFDIL